MANIFQRTNVNNISISWKGILGKVAKWWTLGRLIFNIFIIDVFRNSNLKNLANDNTLYAFDKN